MAILDTDPMNGYLRSTCPGAWSVPAEFVTLLISQSGSAGSTTFTDSAKSQPIVVSNASWSSAFPLFGKNTIYCNNGYLRLNNYANFNVVANQPFSIEFFYRSSPGNGYYSIFGREATADGGARNIMGMMQDYAQTSRNTTYYGILSGLIGYAPAFAWDSKWTHIAVTRDHGGVIRLFIDGTLVKSATNAAAITSTNPLWLGAGGGGYPVLNGYFAEIRFTKNFPVASFTPPAAPWIP